MFGDYTIVYVCAIIQQIIYDLCNCTTNHICLCDYSICLCDYTTNHKFIKKIIQHSIC